MKGAKAEKGKDKIKNLRACAFRLPYMLRMYVHASG